MNTARITTLAAFIRSQAALTDGHPHKPGPGSVKLNNEEAALAAECLEAVGAGLDVGAGGGLTEARVHNVRNWAAARVGQLSGAVAIVALCDSWIATELNRVRCVECGAEMLNREHRCPPVAP